MNFIKFLPATVFTLVFAFSFVVSGGVGAVWAAATPLPAKQKKIFFGSPEDVLTKKVCKGSKRVTLHCRDKEHYVVSNESHHEVYKHHIAGIGGGYVGVGSDQNFTLIAWARSDFAWLMDYDPVVVWMNYVHRGLILSAPTQQAYLRYWSPKGRAAAMAALNKVYKGNKMKRRLLWIYRNWRSFMHRHFQKKVVRLRRTRIKKGDKRPFSWLHTDATYQYIRKMFQHDRIRVMKGDLLAKVSLRGIGKVTHKLGVPMRIVYLSNAEEFWPYTKAFRKNILGLKMDAKSRVVRTRYGKRYRAGLGRWIYLLQSGQDFQKNMRASAVKSVYAILKRMKASAKGFFTVGL